MLRRKIDASKAADAEGAAMGAPARSMNPPRGLFLLGALALMACGGRSPSAAPTSRSPTSGATDASSSERFVTPTGKVWMLLQTRRSASQSVVSIAGEGFPHTRESISLGEGDPLEVAHLTDLDGNGWSELLIVRRSVGSGSYAALAGVASNSDLSFGPIHIATPDPRDPVFAGYRGHDTVRVEGPCLIRSFPVYKDADPNAQPSGGTREVCYRLEQGEAGFVLEPRLHARS